MDNKEIFTYKYSAAEQNEINRIKEKYVVGENSQDGLEKLRKLDRDATRKGTIVSLILGIFGILVMGGGMSLCMEGPENLFLSGIIIGVTGIVGIVLAYPFYDRITKKEREKIAPEIIKLSDELLK